MALASGSDAAENTVETVQKTEVDDESFALERHHRSFKDVAEHAAAILITALVARAIFAVWGLTWRRGGPSPMPSGKLF